MSESEAETNKAYEIIAGKKGIEITPINERSFIVRPTRVDQTLLGSDLVELVNSVSPYNLATITQGSSRLGGFDELLFGTDNPIDYSSIKSWGEETTLLTRTEMLGSKLKITEYPGTGVWSVGIEREKGIKSFIGSDPILTLDKIGQALVHIQDKIGSNTQPIHLTRMNVVQYQAYPWEHFFIFPRNESE